MSKDPAFLFYPGDWLGGTMTFSRLHKGAYMDLLMAQFNNGPLSMEEIQDTLGADFDSVWPKLSKKFVPNDDGLFYNVRLSEEQYKRKKFTESRRDNLKGSKSSHMDKHMDTHKKKHTDKRMENENEIEDVSEIKNEKGKGGKGEKPTNPEVSEIIQELNDLAGRSFEPDSKYVSKHVEARLKEYPKEDLIDMVRLMVYKWKDDTKMDQYLRPATLFAAENCAKYVQEMKGHRLNGTKPAKEKSKGKTLLDPMQVMREVYQYHESKNQ